MKLTREHVDYRKRRLGETARRSDDAHDTAIELALRDILDHLAATLPEEEEAKAAEDGAMQAAREVLAWGKDNQGLISLQEIAAIIRKHMPKP